MNGGFYGVCIMTENEKELIRMIRESEDPSRAALIAVKTILLYLSQHT